MNVAAGTYVVSWAQTCVDGRHGAPMAAIEIGASWRWSGGAVSLGGIAPSGEMSEPELRRTAAAAARRLYAGSLGGGALIDGHDLDTPLIDKSFRITDGQRVFTATLFEIAEAARPMLVFTGALPPENRDLVVIDATLDDRRLNRRTETPTGVICFTQGTRLATPDGPRRVEDLRPGDRIDTKDDGAQDILWVGARRMSGARLYAIPELRPVRIRQGALGTGRPEDDLIVSPRHRVLLKGAVAQTLFDSPEVLVAAQDLLNDHSIAIDRTLTSVTYVHLMLARHQIVWANGVETESFHPANTSLDTIEAGQRADLLALAPGIDTDPSLYGDPARRMLTATEARLMSGEYFHGH